MLQGSWRATNDGPILSFDLGEKKGHVVSWQPLGLFAHRNRQPAISREGKAKQIIITSRYTKYPLSTRRATTQCRVSYRWTPTRAQYGLAMMGKRGLPQDRGSVIFLTGRVQEKIGFGGSAVHGRVYQSSYAMCWTSCACVYIRVSRNSFCDSCPGPYSNSSEPLHRLQRRSEATPVWARRGGVVAPRRGGRKPNRF